MKPTGTMEVGRKKRSESRRFNTLVRMDDDLCDMARKLAALRSESMAEMFSAWLWPIVQKEWNKEVKKLKGGDE